MSEIRTTTRRATVTKDGVKRRATTAKYHAAEPKVDLTEAAGPSRQRPEGWTGLPVVTAPREAPKKAAVVTVTYSDDVVVTQTRPRTRAERRARNAAIRANAEVFAQMELDELRGRQNLTREAVREEWIDRHDWRRFLTEWLERTRITQFLLEERGLGGLRLDPRMVKVASHDMSDDALDIALVQSSHDEHHRLAFAHLDGDEYEAAVKRAERFRLPEDEAGEYEEVEHVTVGEKSGWVYDAAKKQQVKKKITIAKSTVTREPVIHLYPEDQTDDVDAMLETLSNRADLVEWGMSSKAAGHIAERMGLYRDPAAVYDQEQRALDEQRLASARSWLEANR